MPPDPFPSVVLPMLPTLVKAPFSNPDWIFEPKWDGFRAVCFLRNGEVRLVSRRRNDLTAKFPTLQPISNSVKAKSAILDGEIVALDGNGLPCFDALRSRKAAGDCVIVYYAFDLLHLDGRDLTTQPLLARKAALPMTESVDTPKLTKHDTYIRKDSTVYIDEMGGFEHYLAAALRKKTVPLIVVADPMKADYIIFGNAETKRAGWAKMFFLGSGRSGEMALRWLIAGQKWSSSQTHHTDTMR